MDFPLADPADVATIWRPLSVDETTRVAALITLASAKLRAALPNVDARMALPEGDVLRLDPVLVAGVVAEAVRRVLVNPEGLQSSTRTVGPYSESKTHGAQAGVPQGLQVTREDIASLLPRVGAGPVRTLETGLSRRMLPYRPREVVSYDDRGYPLYEGQVP